MGLGLVAAVLAAASACWQASAASLKPSVTKDGRIVISISGEIAPGDTDAFKAAVKVANDGGKLVSSIRLNSPGGNLLEGTKLADAVRFGKMATNVGQGATCASACFLVFAAGETKFANYTAQIGVHGASDESGAETVQSGAATVSMARIAKELGVPSQIIGRMVVTPPSNMVWLSPQDLMSMGVSMVGKPSQTPPVASTAPAQTAPGEPVQITPQTKASNETPVTWNDLVNRAIKLSSDQNNGNPLFSRFCQPEEKVCIIGLSYKQNDGKLGFLKSVENPDGKIIMREICTINEFKDVRTCVNWDTGASHRDMKDAKGEWYKVADE
jgi:hypothetical protein